MNGLVHSRHGLEKKTGLDKPIGTNGGGLENRYTSHFCHQWLGLMIEAPSNETASLVPATLHIGKAPEAGTGDGGRCGQRMPPPRCKIPCNEFRLINEPPNLDVRGLFAVLRASCDRNSWSI